MARRSVRDNNSPEQAAIGRRFVAIGLAVALLSLIADFFRARHGAFGFDGWIGFYPAFGFLGGFAIIGVSKALGAVLKRPASYYRERRR